MRYLKEEIGFLSERCDELVQISDALRMLDRFFDKMDEYNDYCKNKPKDCILYHNYTILDSIDKLKHGSHIVNEGINESIEELSRVIDLAKRYLNYPPVLPNLATINQDLKVIMQKPKE